MRLEGRCDPVATVVLSLKSGSNEVFVPVWRPLSACLLWTFIKNNQTATHCSLFTNHCSLITPLFVFFSKNSCVFDLNVLLLQANEKRRYE
jgi:hypothetical protein